MFYWGFQIHQSFSQWFKYQWKYQQNIHVKNNYRLFLCRPIHRYITRSHITSCSHKDTINSRFLLSVLITSASNHNSRLYSRWVEESSPCFVHMPVLYCFYTKKLKLSIKKILVQKTYKRFQSSVATNVSARLSMNSCM
jgi:hypothetical protein